MVWFITSGSLSCSSIGFRTKFTRISRAIDLRGSAGKSLWETKVSSNCDIVYFDCIYCGFLPLAKVKTGATQPTVADSFALLAE